MGKEPLTSPGSGAPATEGERRLPLTGRRVLVTRPPEQAGELAARLREYGAEVVIVPMIRIGPPTDPAAARRAVQDLGGYDYVIFTSINAVQAVKNLAMAINVDLTSPGPLVFAVGPGTAAAAQAAGIICQPLAEEFTSEGLAGGLEAHSMSGRRVLLPRSEVGRETLPAALRRRGAYVDDVPVYLTSPDPDSAARLAEVLDTLDVVSFASGSSVAGFGAAVPTGWQRPPGLRIAVIGPVTAQAATVAGLSPDIAASDQTARGLADAIAAYFAET